MSCLNSTEKNSTRNKRVSRLTIIAALLSIILASPATAVVYLDVDGTSEPITYTEEQQDLPKTIVDTNDSLKVVFKSFAPVGYTVNVTTSIFFKISLTGAKFGTSHPTVTAAGTTWFPMVGGQGFSNATVGVTAYESTITVTETSFTLNIPEIVLEQNDDVIIKILTQYKDGVPYVEESSEGTLIDFRLPSPQTINFDPPLSGVVGDTATLIATGGESGNPVIFASTTTDICTCSGTNGEILSYIAEGTCTVTADQAGDANYTSAPTATENIPVRQPAGAAINPPSGLTVSEPAGITTFTIALDSEPTSGVTAVLDTPSGECSASASGPLTAANYATGITVTVTAIDDDIVDGDQTCTVEIGFDSLDALYAAFDPDDVDVTVQDDDRRPAGAAINPTSGLTVSEPAGTTTFTIALDSEPTSGVTAVLDTPSGECSASASGPLTAANYATGITVTVTAIDDDIVDGDQTCTVEIGFDSLDALYAAFDPDDVDVTVQDDDVVSAIPALGPWGLALLSGLIGATGLVFLRRRR